MRSTSIPPETTIFTCRMAGEVEPGADLLHEVGRHPSALARRVEPNAPEPVAERLGHPQRLLGLVLERVDEDDARHLRVDVAVEGLGGAHRVAEDEDEGVGHRPGRGQAGKPSSGRRGRADAATHDARVVHLVGDARMDVARAESDDRDRGRGVDDPPCGGRPAGAGGHDAEDRRLVQAEGRVAGADPHDDLLRPEGIAVVERLDDRIVATVDLAEDLAQVRDRLVGAAQDPLAAREDLHRHDRVEALGRENRAGAIEIDVRGLAGQHVSGRWEAGPRPISRHRAAVYDARRRKTVTATAASPMTTRPRLTTRTRPGGLGRIEDADGLVDALDGAGQVSIGESPVGEPELGRWVGTTDQPEAGEERTRRVHAVRRRGIGIDHAALRRELVDRLGPAAI